METQNGLNMKPAHKNNLIDEGTKNSRQLFRNFVKFEVATA
jgi:hypothetical protein